MRLKEATYQVYTANKVKHEIPALYCGCCPSKGQELTLQEKTEQPDQVSLARNIFFFFLFFSFLDLAALQERHNTFQEITDNWPRQIFNGHNFSARRENTLLADENILHFH